MSSTIWSWPSPTASLHEEVERQLQRVELDRPDALLAVGRDVDAPEALVAGNREHVGGPVPVVADDEHVAQAVGGCGMRAGREEAEQAERCDGDGQQPVRHPRPGYVPGAQRGAVV